MYRGSGMPNRFPSFNNQNQGGRGYNNYNNNPDDNRRRQGNNFSDSFPSPPQQQQQQQHLDYMHPPGMNYNTGRFSNAEKDDQNRGSFGNDSTVSFFMGRDNVEQELPKPPNVIPHLFDVDTRNAEFRKLQESVRGRLGKRPHPSDSPRSLDFNANPQRSRMNSPPTKKSQPLLKTPGSNPPGGTVAADLASKPFANLGPAVIKQKSSNNSPAKVAMRTSSVKPFNCSSCKVEMSTVEEFLEHANSIGHKAVMLLAEKGLSAAVLPEKPAAQFADKADKLPGSKTGILGYYAHLDGAASGRRMNNTEGSSRLAAPSPKVLDLDQRPGRLLQHLQQGMQPFERELKNRFSQQQQQYSPQKKGQQLQPLQPNNQKPQQNNWPSQQNNWPSQQNNQPLQQNNQVSQQTKYGRHLQQDNQPPQRDKQMSQRDNQMLQRDNQMPPRDNRMSQRVNRMSQQQRGNRQSQQRDNRPSEQQDDRQSQWINRQPRTKQPQNKRIFCPACNTSYMESYLGHHRKQIHQSRSKLISEGCSVCKIEKFVTYVEYEKHVASAAHCEESEMKRKRENSRKESADKLPQVVPQRTSAAATGGSSITLRRSTGEAKKTEFAERPAAGGRSSSRSENFEKRDSTDDEMRVVDEDVSDPLVDVNEAGNSRAEDAVRSRLRDIPSVADVAPSVDGRVGGDARKEKSLEDDEEVDFDNVNYDEYRYDFADYDDDEEDETNEDANSNFQSDLSPVEPGSGADRVEEQPAPEESATAPESVAGADKNDGGTDRFQDDDDKPIGQEHLIAVTGLFCKLCHVFYNKESMARIDHCKSAKHKAKYWEFQGKKD